MSHEDDSRELWVLLGLRGLLGDSKAQHKMVQLQESNPGVAARIMAEAQARYDGLSDEQRRKPDKVLASITSKSVRLKLRLLLRALWSALKSLSPIRVER